VGNEGNRGGVVILTQPNAMPAKYLESTAVFSLCKLYRYVLTRTWHLDRPTVVFCMLNPSTADAEQPDPTITRCLNFADTWGYGRLVVVNIFALRSTDPEGLRRATDPVGPENDRHLFEQTAGNVTICAWGATCSKWKSPRIMERPAVATRAMQGALLHSLRLTKDGHPCHPLYLPGNLTPIIYPSPRTT
jgi:hypothetical protein